MNDTPDNTPPPAASGLARSAADPPALINPAHPPKIRALWFMRVLAFLAFADLNYLLIATLTGNPLACVSGGLFDCASALASPYAYFGPIPISSVGVLVYGLIFFILCWLTPSRSESAQKLAWGLLAGLLSLAAASACWFIAIQVTRLSAFCPYCLFAHSIGLVLTWIVFRNATLHRATLIRLMLAAVIPVALLIAVQLVFPHKASTRVIRGGTVATTMPTGQRLGDGRDFDTGPGPDRTLAILGGAVRFKPGQLPLVGSPNAPVVVLVLYDYTCPNCRKLHKFLRSARERYPDQFATAVLPSPLDKSCNAGITETEPEHEHGCELAKIALTVWLASPGHFEAFDTWMMDRETTVSVDEAKAEAIKRIGESEFETVFNSERPAREVQKGVKLYDIAGRGAIPRLLSPTKDEKGTPYTLQILGRPDTEQDLFDVFEESLHLKATGPHAATVPTMLKRPD